MTCFITFCSGNFYFVCIGRIYIWPPNTASRGSLNPCGRYGLEGSADSLLNELEPVLQQLSLLDLGNTDVTDEGLAQIGKFPNLRRLHPKNTLVSDAGLQQMAGLSNLEYLNLYGTGVTDSGLQELKSLNNLRKLFVWQTNVTEKGAKQLREILSDIDIYIYIYIYMGLRDTTNVAETLN